MNNECWEVGPEYDRDLLLRLAAVLKRMQFDLVFEWHGVGGSQDISHWEFKCAEGTVVVESETYMGLSVTGPTELVQSIRNAFDAAKAN